MADPDAFFTLTIVGAPTSWVLGRRLSASQAQAQGVQVRLDTGLARLTSAWRDTALLGEALAPDGRPRRRPSPTRRWLERHALAIALFGLACLISSGVLAGIVLWN